MPALKDLTKSKGREKKRTAMTADQMMTMARMWSSVAGPPIEKGSHE